MQDSLKTPPADNELELSILSGCILDTEMCADALFMITENDFYSTKHVNIFKCIQELNYKNEPVDLKSILLKSKELKIEMSASYLSEIVNNPIPSNMEFYCEKLRLFTIKRNTILTCRKTIQRIYESDSSIDDIDEFQKNALKLDCTVGTEKTYTNMRTLVNDGEDRHEELYKNKKNITGIPSGFKYVDEKTCGFQNGDLILLAGRPSMGKSALAGNISLNIAKKGYANIIFSLEMAERQFYDRMLSSESGIDLMKFRNGFFSKEDWGKRNHAAGNLYSLPIFIDDTSKAPMDIQRKSRVAKKQDDIKCVIIDFLTLMDLPGKDSRNNEVGNIAKNLKHMAKELDIPVILLSQLNRKLENRDNKRPNLSDLRDSGELEQHADVVMFIYRQEVYIKEKKDENGNFTKKYLDWKGRAELIISKQRMGPIGTVPLTWIEEITTFKNYKA